MSCGGPFLQALLRSAVFVAIDNENEDLALLHPNQKVATITKTHAGEEGLVADRVYSCVPC